MKEFAVLNVPAVFAVFALIVRVEAGSACDVVLALFLEFAQHLRPHLSLCMITRSNYL